MAKIGFLTCEKLSPSHAPRIIEDDLLCARALEGAGHQVVPLVWDQSNADLGDYSLLVLRSTWDYFEKFESFKEFISRCERERFRLLNPPSLVQWNFTKAYLRELQEKGAHLTETVWLKKGESLDLPALMAGKGWTEAVVKPVVSANAYSTFRVQKSNINEVEKACQGLIERRDIMIQEFLPEVLEGELSFIFFDGEYSHSVRKVPKAQDFRVQAEHGATTFAAHPDARVIDQARSVLRLAPEKPVYARVDGILREGKLLVMELELIEPSLYLEYCPGSEKRFAEALLNQM